MFDQLAALLSTLNSLSPLGVIGLLGVVILLLVHKRGPLKTLTDNHLSHVQVALDRIAESSDRQVELLYEIKEDISYVKGKLD